MADYHPSFSKFFQNPKSEVESEEELKSYNHRRDFISTLPCENGKYRYKGYWFRHRSLLGILSFQEHFKASPDDIFIQTYMKSGTTWIKALVFAIVNRRSVSYEDHPLLSTHPQDCATFLEGVFATPRLPDLDVLPGPRLFASHIPYSLLPDPVKNCRIVYVGRDPKDTLVSLWRFLDDIRGPAAPPVPLGEVFEEFCEGRVLYGSIWDHQMEYRKASSRRPDKVLFLRYEEMKAEPEESVWRIAEFLGEGFTDEEAKAGAVTDIARLCSFQFLKELEVNKEGEYVKIEDGVVRNSSFFRKGEVGDWKQHLTPEMAEKIDRITQEKLGQYELL